MTKYTFNVDSGVNVAFEALVSSNFAGTELEEALTIDSDSKNRSHPTCSLDSSACADETYENGQHTINVFELPTVTIFAIRGAGNHIDVSSPNISITDHLRRWDSDCSYEELLVSFGLEEDADETIEEADEDDTNVRIWCSYYYTDKNSWPISGYETDEDRDHLVFATFAEAEAWINTETGGTYHLRCNEYARPSYTIVR